nr:MAG TPA: hypothetical protein [Caudoviricetes sp.]
MVKFLSACRIMPDAGNKISPVRGLVKMLHSQIVMISFPVK